MPGTNQQIRKAFWEHINTSYSQEQIQTALQSLKPDSAKILQLHYVSEHPLREIAQKLSRSISYIRHHHNKGIFQLQNYFESTGNARPF